MAEVVDTAGASPSTQEPSSASSSQPSPSPSEAHEPRHEGPHEPQHAQERAQARENSIPHSRVREMMSKHEQKIRQEYDERIRGYEDRIRQFESAGGSSQRAAVSSPQHEVDSFFGRGETTFGRNNHEAAQLRQEMAATATALRHDFAWSAFQAANKDAFKAPGAERALRAAFTDAYRSGHPDPARAIATLVNDYRKIAAERQALAERERARQKSPARKAVPAGLSGWAQAPRDNPGSNGKPSVADKIQARLRASRDSE